MVWLEYALWIYFCIYPFYIAFTYKQEKALLLSNPNRKIDYYCVTIAHLWLPTVLLLLLVFGQAISLEAIGIDWQWNWRTQLAVGAFTLIGAYIYISLKQLQSTPALKDEVIGKTEDLAWILPTTKQEHNYFVWGVSVSAGICEELLFRGYLIPLISAQLPLYMAVFLSSVMFGLFHLYQGWQGVIKTSVLGGVFALIYIATGSIIIPILFHILVDVYSGTLFYVVRK